MRFEFLAACLFLLLLSMAVADGLHADLATAVACFCFWGLDSLVLIWCFYAIDRGLWCCPCCVTEVKVYWERGIKRVFSSRWMFRSATYSLGILSSHLISFF